MTRWQRWILSIIAAGSILAGTLAHQAHVSPAPQAPHSLAGDSWPPLPSSSVTTLG